MFSLVQRNVVLDLFDEPNLSCGRRIYSGVPLYVCGIHASP